jgi:uncharacterized membrane protein
MDLLLVAGLVLIIDIFVLLPEFSDSFLRIWLGIFLVLFLPGYAFAGALFPAKKDLEGIERVAISFGLNIAIVPLLGLGLNYSTWGIREVPLLTEFSIFILLMCVIAYYRRSLLSEAEAFSVSFRAYYQSIKVEVFEKHESKTDTIITFILIFSFLASIGSLAYIVGNPKEGEHFTEFYILGNNRTAGDYPTEFVKGEKGTVTVGIINHEHRPMDYTMELRLANRSLPLSESQKKIILEDNMSWEKPITFTPPVEGKNMKLEFLLFNDNNKTVPYRNLHFWINVTKEA